MVVLFLEVKKIKISVYVCLMFIQKKNQTKTKQTNKKKNEKKTTKNRKVDETLYCVTCVWPWPLTRTCKITFP